MLGWLLIASNLALPMVCAFEQSKMLECHDLTVRLPGPGWQRAQLEKGSTAVAYAHPDANGRMHMISVWAVDVPPNSRSLNEKEHAANYFDYERKLDRPDGRWEFKEQSRAVGTIHLLGMSFQMFPFASDEHVMNGLFLAYFPSDFAKRHRFFVLMWSDLHRKVDKARQLDELDEMVRSARLRPLNGKAAHRA
jgi:hypothetical protein